MKNVWWDRKVNGRFVMLDWGKEKGWRFIIRWKERKKTQGDVNNGMISDEEWEMSNVWRDIEVNDRTVKKNECRNERLGTVGGDWW